MDQNYKRAEKKIAAALKAGATVLNLAEMGLKELPESIGELTGLQELDLSNNGLTFLPESIGNITGLQELHLSNNELTSLTESIGNIPGLQSLYLSHNRLTSLTESFGNMTGLKRLDLSRNRLTPLPESIGNMTGLRVLDLSANGLTSLPESIGNITGLRVLDLSANGLTSLPESIGNITGLRVLHLSHNKLTSLPESIGNITGLQNLKLSINKLTSLPESIGNITGLQILKLSNNKLTSLPRSLKDLVHRGVLSRLYLHGNPALGLPDEVLGPTNNDVLFKNLVPKPPREIVDYYFSTRGNAGEQLSELRLIVVGKPKVGKTSLLKRLRWIEMDLTERETHGIDINTLDLRCSYGSVRAHAWDFGGQHVLHAMHEFFLRSNCLYLLVVEQRSSDVERDVVYWLQLIRSYAGDAPVVVALNQSKGIIRPIARAELERDYGPISGWVATECLPEASSPGADGTIEALRTALTDAAESMPGPRKLFPKKWLQIKQWLEGMKEPYMDYAEYMRHCQDLDEKDSRQQSSLAATMDDLGVALNYARDPRLRDTTILRPNWLASGIYALLRANILHDTPLAPEGVLTPEKVGEVLAAADTVGMLQQSEYPEEKWQYLLRLMNLFQLSFPLDETDERYLVPALLSSEAPAESEEPDGDNQQKLRYEFDIVPGPFIGRLMVRLFAIIDGKKRWQRGMRLRYGDARALVSTKLQDKYVYVTIAGDERDARDLLEIIRETMKEMFLEYDRLHVVEQWSYKENWVPRATLEDIGQLPREREFMDTELLGKEAYG